MAATINVHMTTKEGIATPLVTGMRPIDPAWRASASHAPPTMSRRAATKASCVSATIGCRSVVPLVCYS